MAGYRNSLVHMYNQVKKEEIYEIIQTKINDFERFCEEIINYL